MSATISTETASVMPVPEFLTGAHAKLRPVLEADLPLLAPLLAEAPHNFSWDNEPWTVSRLRKKFNDEKEPGLWSRKKRYLVVTDHESKICGVLVEILTRLGNVSLDFHIANARPDRDVLGPDALRTYVEYQRGWHNCPRIMTMLVATQRVEQEWLKQCGFEHEMTCADAWLHEGRVEAIEVYAWLADWVRANRAPDGIGE